MNLMQSLKQQATASVQVLARRYSSTARLSDVLSRHLPQVMCIDVGASYYPHPQWRLMLSSPGTRWIAVEPNVENIGYVHRWEWPCQVSAVTTGLSRQGGLQTLYVTHVDSGSSLLEPLVPESQKHRFRDLDYFFPVRPRSIETMTLLEVIRASGDAIPTFVKLDTQGTELSILQGAEPAMAARQIVGIELESTLLAQPVMQGAGKFWEACRDLEALGFELLRLKPIPGTPRKAHQHARANTFLNECDAVFALRRDIARDLSVEHRTALLAFYLCNRLYDESHDLLENDAAVRSALKGRGCDVDRLDALIDRLS
ncbi:MAG: FkbM family methyltransferase [Caldimonas sp.]